MPTEAPAWSDTEAAPTWDQTQDAPSWGDTSPAEDVTPSLRASALNPQDRTPRDLLEPVGGRSNGASPDYNRDIVEKTRKNFLQAWEQDVAQNGPTNIQVEEPTFLQAIHKPLVRFPRMESPQVSGRPQAEADVATGAVNAASAFAEFFTSPIGIATFGLGGVPEKTRQVVSGYFATSMAKQMPELANQFAEAWKAGDTTKATENALNGALNLLFITGAAKHALERAPNPSAEIGKRIGEAFARTVQQTEFVGSADKAAIEALKPERAQFMASELPKPKAPPIVKNLEDTDAPMTAKVVAEDVKSPALQEAYQAEKEAQDLIKGLEDLKKLDLTRITEEQGAALDEAIAANPAEPPIPNKIQRLQDLRNTLPFGEKSEIPPEQLSAIATSLRDAGFRKGTEAEDMVSGLKEFPTKEKFEQSLEGNLTLDAMQLISKVEQELRDVGLDPKQAALPKREDFKTPEEFWSAAFELEGRMRQEGASLLASLVRNKQAEGFKQEPPTGETETVGEAPPKVGNTSAIPTPEESARWDALTAYQTPIVESLSGEQLDSLAARVDVKRRGVNDVALREKILSNTHPDDLQDAITAKALATVEQPPAPLTEKAATEAVKPEPKSMEGPGGTIASGVGADKSEITQLAESITNLNPDKKQTRLKDPITVTVKSKIASALQSLKDATTKAKDYLRNPPNFDSIDKAIGVWSREHQESGRDAYQAWKSIEKETDPVQRDAIGAYIDAGGDRTLMQDAASTLPPKYAKAYERALNLTAEEKIVADNIRNYFDKRLEEAKANGILEDGLENYIRRVYEKEDAQFAEAEVAKLKRLNTGTPDFAKKRFYETDIAAIRAGLKPVQDFARRMLIYDQEMNIALADRRFVKSLMGMEMSDGRPMIDVSGMGSRAGDEPGEAVLIRPQYKPKDAANGLNDRTDYKNYDHPSFRKWKWVTEDTGGNPVMVQGDVLVHPDAIGRVSRLLDRSLVKENPYSNAALKVSSVVKQTMLDLSGFHQVQIGLHALEHRVVPSKKFGNLTPIDLKDATQKSLVEHGLVVFEHSAMNDFAEGVHGNSVLSKVPGLGSFANTYHEWLFKEFIPTIKMTMAQHALERNRSVYPKYTEDQLLRLTAEQANAAFGGQNWKMLGKSETQVDLMRLAFLAPDFLVSRMKFVGQALKPGGREQLTALAFGALSLYTFARIANTMISGNPHTEPENMFSLVFAGRSYGLRTIQGDILHLITEPGKFWYHRLNPTLVQPLIQLATGRNYFGRTVGIPETLLEQAGKPIPISLKGLFSGKDQNLWESALNAFGVQTKRFNAATKAYDMARKWKKAQGVKEEPGEFIYDETKDPLHNLKVALQYEDTAKAAVEIKKLVQSKTFTESKLNAYFVRYAKAPFTGSAASEAKFLNSLSWPERKSVAEAREQKRRMLEQYRTAKRAMPL